MKLPYVKNQRATDISGKIEPWSYVNTAPKFIDKKEASLWNAKETTDHCFYNGFEGVLPNQRINADNPAKTLYALVGDYDFPSSSTEWDQIYAESPEDFKPYAMSNTQQGRLRIVWLLETPVSLGSSDLWEPVLKRIARKYGLNKLFKAFDEKFYEPGQYYEVGKNWRVWETAPKITENQIQTAIFETVKFLNSQAKIEIPLDKIAAEVEKKYPGGWKGEFKEGARGRRFWIPEAIPTCNAAYVGRQGMFCHVDNRWIRWGELLGKVFTRSANENKYGELLKTVHVCKDNYYFFEDEKWREYSKPDCLMKLKVMGLDSRIEKGATASEIDIFLNLVKRTREVEGATPCPHQPEYVIEDNKRYLNISTVKLMPPGDGGKFWGEKFPWIASFLRNLFDNEHQLPIFLAWLQRALHGAQEKDPRMTRSLFLIGPKSCGKTLLVQRMIKPMFGGLARAEKFILNKTQFNGNLFEYFVWYLDELRHGMSEKEKAEFSNTVKLLTANDLMECENKFKDSINRRRRGIIIFTLNNDETSSDGLPNIEAEILDKIMFMQTGNMEPKAPADMTIEQVIAKELPHFIAYLTHAHVVDPKLLLPNNRFGTVDYHHPDMIAMVRENSGHTMLQEILENYFSSILQDLGKNDKIWKGSATSLYTELLGSEAFGKVIGRWQPKQFGHQLTQIRRNGSSKLTFSYNKNRESGDRWHIYLQAKIAQLV